MLFEQRQQKGGPLICDMTTGHAYAAVEQACMRYYEVPKDAPFTFAAHKVSTPSNVPFVGSSTLECYHCTLILPGEPHTTYISSMVLVDSCRIVGILTEVESRLSLNQNP